MRLSVQVQNHWSQSEVKCEPPQDMMMSMMTQSDAEFYAEVAEILTSPRSGVSSTTSSQTQSPTSSFGSLDEEDEDMVLDEFMNSPDDMFLTPEDQQAIAFMHKEEEKAYLQQQAHLQQQHQHLARKFRERSAQKLKELDFLISTIRES